MGAEHRLPGSQRSRAMEEIVRKRQAELVDNLSVDDEEGEDEEGRTGKGGLDGR